MAEMLEIRSLGGLEIALNGDPVEGLGLRKASALLLYLAYTGRPHTREALATVLWSDYPAERARNNLSVLLTALRKQLGAFVTITRQTVAFNAESHHWLDATVLERELKATEDRSPSEGLLSQAEAARLEEALALYRGDFLAGFHVLKARNFEEWALLERERLRQKVIRALDTLIDSYLARGFFQPGLSAGRRLLELEPWRERTHRQMMIVLARAGQRPAALQQYEICRHVLQEELGIEPTGQTTALYERIQSLSSTRRTNLPTRLTPFVGRKRELAKIMELMAQPSCRLLTLLGPGGIGKTRLALEATEAQRGRYLDGVFFVSLASVSSADGLHAAVADALEVSFAGPQEPGPQLIDYFRDKEALLVLDNFEHLLPATRFVTDLLRRAPAVKLLATSRERLKLQAEWVIDVSGLETPADLDETGVVASDAVQLFLQSARRAGAAEAVRAQELPSVVRICRATEGMPLAVELAASWTRTLSCQEIAREIERSLVLLEAGSADLPSRHRSLRAVFDHSWHLLSEDERLAWAKLAVFRDSFSRKAAEAVCGTGLPDLSALVDKSLLRKQLAGREATEARYDMHELVWRYAAEKLDAEVPDAEQLRELHREYFLDYLKQQRFLLESSKPLEGIAAIRAELGNVLTAWGEAVKGCHLSQLDQMMPALHRFFWMRGRYQEGQRTFAEAADHLLQSEHGQDPDVGVAVAKLRARQGWYLTRIGRLEGAKEMLERCLAQLLDDQARADRAFALIGLAQVYHLTGAYRQADELCQQSLAIAQNLGDQRLVADSLFARIRPLTSLADPETTLTCLEESARIYQNIGDQWRVALVRNEAGLFHLRHGDHKRAREAFEESLIALRELDSPRETAACLLHIGVTAQRQGHLEEAKQRYREALPAFRDVGDRRAIAAALQNLGEVAGLEGNYLEAEKRCWDGLVISKAIPDQPRVAYALSTLGHLASAQGLQAKALEHFRGALELAWPRRVDWVVLDVLVGLAGIWLERGEAQKAAEWLGLILSHPAVVPDTQIYRAEPLSMKLAARLPREALAKAKERGQALQLEEIVSGLLVQEPKGHDPMAE